MKRFENLQYRVGTEPVTVVRTRGLYQLLTGSPSSLGGGGNGSGFGGGGGGDGGYNGEKSISIESLKEGITLPGGLKVKKAGKNTVTLQEDFGGVGNLYSFHPDGHGALRFYGNEIVDGEKKGKDREKKTRSW